MTVDEMIEAMNGHLVEMRDAAPHVIAALRAGQAMREAIDLEGCGSITSYSLFGGAKAWDAATKGDEG